MTGSERDELLARWRTRFATPVRGWDLREFEAGGRAPAPSDAPPWNYHDLAVEALHGCSAAVDMGTGGGEVLIELLDRLPHRSRTIAATEGWEPNVAVAREALTPRGVQVVEYDAERGAPMPFPDATFDLVLNRHEAYEATEVFRVLRPGGVFLTQQVDGRDAIELRELFGAGPPPYAHVRLDLAAAVAESAGLLVEDARDWTGVQEFAGVDALVRYAAWVPWSFPDDFSVDAYADVLLALHAAGGHIAVSQRRWLLRATRPTAS